MKHKWMFVVVALVMLAALLTGCGIIGGDLTVSIWHDDARSVTCYTKTATDGGLYCIPDWQLVPQKP